MSALQTGATREAVAEIVQHALELAGEMVLVCHGAAPFTYCMRSLYGYLTAMLRCRRGRLHGRFTADLEYLGESKINSWQNIW